MLYVADNGARRRGRRRRLRAWPGSPSGWTRWTGVLAVDSPARRPHPRHGRAALAGLTRPAPPGRASGIGPAGTAGERPATSRRTLDR